MKLMMLACEIIYREVCYAVAQSKNMVDVKFLRKGLHDIGCEKMSSRLQEEINHVPKDTYDAVVLGYALCNNGIQGLYSEHYRLVVPRAHDCITFLLGSKEKYGLFMEKHPGTYFRSTGWIERNSAELGDDDRENRVMTQLGLDKDYEEYVKQYGEENAKYIWEVMQGGLNHYDTLGYVEIPELGGFPEYVKKSKKEAEEKGWQFVELAGDIGLIRSLVDGDWDSEKFLMLSPGNRIVPAYSDEIVNAQPK